MDRQDFAQTLGLRALAWLAGEEEHLGAFLAQSGLGPGELKARAAEPELLAAILDFILGDEAMVLAFADAAALAPASVAQARAHLPGGDAPFWT